MADLLYNAVLERYTGEDFDEEFEFDGRIPESTTVTDETVTVHRTDGVDVTNDVALAVSHSGTVVTVSLRTGSSETAYLVKVVAQASDLSYTTMTKLLNVIDPGVFR